MFQDLWVLFIKWYKNWQHLRKLNQKSCQTDLNGDYVLIDGYGKILWNFDHPRGLIINGKPINQRRGHVVSNNITDTTHLRDNHSNLVDDFGNLANNIPSCYYSINL